MTVKDIVMQYLIDNNYDGLCADIGCACLLNDLMPCENNTENCVVGHRVKCNKQDRDNCDYDYCLSVNKNETECINKENE